MAWALTVEPSSPTIMDCPPKGESTAAAVAVSTVGNAVGTSAGAMATGAALGLRVNTADSPPDDVASCAPPVGLVQRRARPNPADTVSQRSPWRSEIDEISTCAVPVGVAAPDEGAHVTAKSLRVHVSGHRPAID